MGSLLQQSCGGNNSQAQTTQRQVPTGPAHITVNIPGKTGGTAFLIGMVGEQQYKADSATIDANGRVEFIQPAPYEPGFYLVVLPDNTVIQMLIDADQEFSLTKGNGPTDVTVQGSRDNELLYQTMRFEEELQPQINAANQYLQSLRPEEAAYAQAQAELDALIAQRKTRLEETFNENPNTFFTSFKRAGQNPDVKDIRLPDGSIDQAAQLAAYRQAFWDGVDFSDERLMRTPVIFNKLKRYVTELTPQQPDSINRAASALIDRTLPYPEYYQYIANWIALRYEPTKTTLMDPEAVFVHLVQNYFTYERATWSDSANIYALQLRAHEMAGSLTGHTGPDVTSTDPEGKSRSISELRAPYVIVYMYNPTCEHCMVETPKLIDFYRTHKGEVDVYAIAVDTDREEWLAYIKKNGMPWTNVFDPTNRSIYGKYYVDITPEIYVLDATRTIRAKNLKVEQIAEVIARDKTR